MGFLNYSPLEGVKFQYVSLVVCLSFGQVSAHIQDHGIHPIIKVLITDGPQSTATDICMQLKGFIEVSVDQERLCCAHALQFIFKVHWHQLSQWIGAFFFPAFSLTVNSFEGPGYMGNSGYKLVIVTCVTKETPNFSDRVGISHFLIFSVCLLLVAIPYMEVIWPR